jgi:hypothetical protein
VRRRKRGMWQRFHFRQRLNALRIAVVKLIILERIDNRPDLSNNIFLTKARVTGGFIKRAERFGDREESVEEQTLFLNVNYKQIKKSTPGYTIHKPTANKKTHIKKQALKSKVKRKTPMKPKEPIKVEAKKEELQEELREEPKFEPIIQESPISYRKTIKCSPIKDDNAIDAFFKAKSEWKKNYDAWAAEHEKDLTELSTVASTVTTRSKKRASSPKPIRTSLIKEEHNMYTQVERSQPKFTFGKSRRPLSQSVSYENFGFLYPSLTWVKTNHPGPKITKKLPLTKQLELRKKETEELELERSIRDYMKPLDPTEYLLPKKNIPIITKPLIDQENKLNEREELMLRLHKVPYSNI